MSQNVIQHSFSSGELSPQLMARTDLGKYHSGLATCRNFFVDYRAGASTRQGTRYLGTITGTNIARVVAFQVTAQQGFLLLFTHLSITMYKNGVALATVASPYIETDLAILKFAQSVSILTITHPSYAPRNLVRVTDLVWNLITITFTTSIGTPVPALAFVVGKAGAVNVVYSYQVTAVDINGQEGRPGTISTSVGADNIGAVSAYLSWPAISGAVAYNIYRGPYAYGTGPYPSGATYGLIGVATGLSTVDTNSGADFGDTPPIGNNPFAAGNNPGVCAYYQQRQVFGASSSQPQSFWMSKPAAFGQNFANFDFSFPIAPDDSITGTLVSEIYSGILFFKSTSGGLITLTARGAWLISGGGQLTPITPIDAQAQPQAYNGCANLPPIAVNYDILYVQAKGAAVRDLSFNFYTQIYTGTDISVLSEHLFFDYQLQEWAFAEEPFKIVWAVRNDGVCLSLTFLKEQEIAGWARHDTNGLFMSVASVTEGITDAVYFVVKRFISGAYVLFLERMADRSFPYGIEDAWSLDAALQSAPLVNGSSVTTSTATITASQSGVGTGVTFTSDIPLWNVGHVGLVLRMGGGIATLTGFTSSTIMVGTITQAISAVIPGSISGRPLPQTGPGGWTLWQNATTFTGLSHLNGKLVNVIADGVAVLGLTPVAGSITIPTPASKVTVGIPYTAQLQTMYLDTGEPTIQGKRKKVNALTLRLKESRGLSAGRTFSTLVSIRETAPPILAPATGLLTLDERVVMDPLWDVPGQICIQQTNPFPATVLGVILEISLGDTAK